MTKVINEKSVEKLCQWSYHRGRFGMIENIYKTFQDGKLIGKDIVAMLEKIMDSEKKDLVKKENELDKCDSEAR